MTHDHHEDLAILDAALRSDHLGPIGVIGSSAKWVRFRAKLVAAGIDARGRRRRRDPHRPAGRHLEQGPRRHRGVGGRRPARGVRARERGRPVTIFRGTFLDTPDSPFTGGSLRTGTDLGLLVRDGVILERGPFAEVSAAHRDEEVVDLSEGLVLPGFVDTHVHFPQVRAIGGLGMPLLDWLEKCALPEEARLADDVYAAGVATDFVAGLARAGTTTALVFGSHFAGAVDALFTEASRVGLRVTSGLVLSRPDPAARPVHHSRARLRRGPRAGEAVARPGQPAVRRDAAVLAVVHDAAHGVGRRAARRRARALVHLAPQRERRGDRRRPAAVRLRLHDVLRAAPVCSAPAACSRTTCTPRSAS